MILGSHLSIAGGLHNCLLAARRLKFDCAAMFVRNQRRWASPPLRDEDAELFRKTRAAVGMSPVIAHASYLLNLAAVGEQRTRTLTALADEADRCRRLGVEYLVVHPGSCADESEGVRLIADALSEVAGGYKGGPMILVESTAGSGNAIGWRFEQLAAILAECRPARRFGVCLDTCHVFAAGYDIRTPATYAATMTQFDNIVGLANLRAIHVNDSIRALGSRVDRHAHIGQGQIGREGSRNFARDARLAETPFIMETPKGLDAKGRDWDYVNGQTMRRLAKQTVGR